MEYVDKVKKGEITVAFKDTTSGYQTEADVKATVAASFAVIEDRLSKI